MADTTPCCSKKRIVFNLSGHFFHHTVMLRRGVRRRSRMPGLANDDLVAAQQTQNVPGLFVQQVEIEVIIR